MKTYQKLPIPKDTAWERKTWKKYVHWKIKQFIYGLQNLINWFSIIWKDRHWDDYYITKMIQHKIELQRAYLVNANRHTNISTDNFWMTVVLNLLEREHEEYYSIEYQDYIDEKMIFEDIPDRPGCKELRFETNSENLDEYLAKYPGAVRRVKQIYEHRIYGQRKNFSDKKTLAFFVAAYNQKRCRNLIFEILKNKSHEWWD